MTAGNLKKMPMYGVALSLLIGQFRDSRSHSASLRAQLLDLDWLPGREVRD